MKKIFVILTILFFKMNLQAQPKNFGEVPENILSQLSEMGITASPFLNTSESSYFNFMLKYSRNDFDFTGKKIAFFTGSNGKTVSNNKEFFEKEKERFVAKTSPNAVVLFVLNESQKQSSGGYDAVIIYWNKVVPKIDDLIQLLKNCTISGDL